MSVRPGPVRRGISLTEILISILIMGVGLLSLATLFPLGMVRLRAAAQQSRSAYLAESATADLSSQNLLFRSTFLMSWYGANSPYGVLSNADTGGNTLHDPFTMDPLPNGKVSPTGSSAGGLDLAASSGPGLPFCYDPLWWYVATGNAVSGTIKGTGEFRFGQGVFYTPGSATVANTFLRPDPGGGTASAYGLQRVTNFVTTAQLNAQGINSSAWSLLDPRTVFISPDDPVMQNSDAPPQILTTPTSTVNGEQSGVVPLNFAGSTTTFQFQNDWRYTWLFTGQQVDVTNATAFVGNVVVMDSRPLAIDSVLSPTTGSASQTAAGEVVMEAIFAYSGSVLPAAGPGYGVAADRTVLLRWSSSMPDPEVRVGGWFADVTYERNTQTSNSRVGNGFSAGASSYPMQRCNWYQVAKRGDAQVDPDVAGYRRMVVTTSTPVKARTLLNKGGTPVNLNVAVFMPSVVNVFTRTIFVRTDY